MKFVWYCPDPSHWYRVLSYERGIADVYGIADPLRGLRERKRTIGGVPVLFLH